jgi:phage terminase large subunit-like protein
MATTSGDQRTLADFQRLLPANTWQRVIRGIKPDDRDAALASWFAHGRPQQMPPAGDWHVWLLMAGRGFGKTRAGSEWARTVALEQAGVSIAIVGATLHETRAIMVEGPAGLLAIGKPASRPLFQPSLRRLVWPNGSTGQLYSADDPDALRGGQHSHAWGDEIAKWPKGEAAWMNLRMGLRLGARPQALLTTTPRPTRLVKMLIADPSVTVTRGTTRDNAANLAPGFVDALNHIYGGTRLGRQELEGELVDDIDGALWTRTLVEQSRTQMAGPPVRVVIGVDPPAGTGQASVCGIVVAGMLADGVIVIIEDASVAGVAPEAWARAVADAALRHHADRVVAEANNGGAMVKAVLEAADIALPVALVHAARGKAARAEPVAIRYAAGGVRHAGVFPQLEDELCALTPGGGYEGPGRSPDRADALVWAVSELVAGTRRAGPSVRVV